MWQSSAIKKHSENVFVVSRIFVILLIFSSAYFQGIDLLWKDEGDLLSPKMRSNLSKNQSVWKPRSCSMHNYTNKEFASCWRKKDSNMSVLFLGDSHERALYYMFLAKVQDSNFFVNKEVAKLSYYDKNLNVALEYEFMPIFNNSFKEKLKSFENFNIPDLIILGCNLHPILVSNASKINRFLHRKRLTSFLPHMDNIARKTTVLWYIQPPVIDAKIMQHRRVVQNKHVDLYNKIALEIISRTRIKVWTSAREIAIDEMDSYSDDIHVGQFTCEYYAQILSNFWCNEKSDFLDGSCWKQMNSSSLGSDALCFLILIIIIIVIILFLRKNQMISWLAKKMPVVCLLLWKDFKLKFLKKFGTYFSIILKFLLTIGYVYICERISVYAKEEIDSSEFFLLTSLSVVLILSIYYCSPTQENKNLLRNHVINETKGLAIIFLLVSSVANDWEANAYINHFSQSTFILVMGVELFYHSWCGKSMNFSHFIQEMIIMNILVILLCLVLNHPYVEYGILPVTILCYTFCYAILASPPRSILKATQDDKLSSNTTLTKVVVYFVKISVIVGAFTSLHWSMTIERQILSHPISRSFFATKEDTLAPWLFCWKIDKFSFPLGIIIGFIIEIFTFLCDKFKSMKIGNHMIINWSVTLSACIFFTIQSSMALDHFSSLNERGSYYPFLFANLVFSYILCRSCLLKIWPKYSKVLAMLGPFWLEIYLLHFHIWMAFDGNAILILLPFSSTLNFCAITFIFVFICCDIRNSINNLIYE